MSDEKTTEEKKTKESEETQKDTEVDRGIGIWKIVGILIIVLIIAGLYFGISHFGRLNSALDYRIRTNQPPEVTPETMTPGPEEDGGDTSENETEDAMKATGEGMMSQ